MAILNQINLKAIFLDRDGCINKLNDKSRYVSKIEDFHLYSDAVQFLNFIIPSKVEIAVVTNQKGIALGEVSQDFVEVAHLYICQKCNTTNDRIKLYVCPHLDASCTCRKPKPGLLLLAAAAARAMPEECVFIGDSMTDFEAAESAGMLFIGIDRDSQGKFDAVDVETYSNFMELVQDANILNGLPS